MELIEKIKQFYRNLKDLTFSSLKISFSDIREEFRKKDKKIEDLEKTFIGFHKDLIRLNNIISHQKGRITRQTREQNKENNDNIELFEEIANTLGVLNKRLSKVENEKN